MGFGEKSQRQLQVGEEIKKILSSVLLTHDFFDSTINSNNLSISYVDISADLKNAKIYVSSIFGDNQIGVKNLNKHVNVFRHKLSKTMTTRTIPKIIFVHDNTVNNAVKINTLINDLD